MSVKMYCVVCNHEWVAQLKYGLMPNYVECKKCVEKELRNMEQEL